MILQFLLTVIISAIMYAGGEGAAAGVLSFAKRLAGPRGEEVTILAAKAIKSVALGIVVTALIQTAIGGTGLVISGIPGAPVLAAVVFMLCLAQLGPILVMVPSVIWIYWKGDPLWGTVLLIFTVIAGGIDNFIRPVLIKKGVDLPLIMIFAGVIGGLIAFGVIGLFIGPVVLAVTYTLLKAWVHSADTGEASAAGGK
jgi:predicted PurR-regulated permease PerM